LKYLLTISIGPVQSLIEAGRRTRDLWCGSWLLSESSKAAALFLHEHEENCLIFPYIENVNDLIPQEHFEEQQANISNIIRAIINVGNENDINYVIEGAKQAALTRFSQICDRAKSHLGNLPLHGDLWEQQKQDIIDAYSAWVCVDEDYLTASKRLGALLASRKATRNFLPMQNTKQGIPKSSLDGARESVIALPRSKRKNGQHTGTLRKLGLNNGEELDTLGVAKRLAGDAEQFTPFSRIVADTWINSLSGKQLQELSNAYNQLAKQGLATRVNGNDGLYKILPYDGELLFPSRLENAIDDLPTLESSSRHIQELSQTLKSINSSPVPYGVMLKADGDKMGELLSNAKSETQSKKISKELHGFACGVRDIVKRNRGHAIYAGGDDVLAFVPLISALDCARQLAISFKEIMAPIANELNVQVPTLSVGLAIGHTIQPMKQLRGRAVRAEKIAKGNGLQTPRNALAICLGLRSGPEITWRCSWNDQSSLKLMEVLLAAFDKRHCPSQLGYELRAINERLSAICIDDESTLDGIYLSELQRLLDRARLPDAPDKSLSNELKNSLFKQAVSNGTQALANQLIIARWLSASTSADLGVKE